jgi:membrane protease YdiL (CAAX protease family)
MQFPAMLILAEAPDPHGVIYSALIAAVVLIAGFFAGAFRPRRVAAPPRIDPGESPELVWMIILLAFAIWSLAPPVLLALLSGAAQVTQVSTTAPATAAPATTAPVTTAAATAPTTAGAQQLSAAAPGLIVAVLLAVNCLLGCLLVGANLRLRPGGLQRMGFALSMLRIAIIPAILASLIVLPLTFFVTEITQWLLYLLNVEHPSEHMLLRIFSEKDNPLLHAMIILSAVIVAPIVEEFLYRGHLQSAFVSLLQRIRANVNPEPMDLSVDRAIRWIAIVVTSIVFAAAHQELWMMLPIFFLSLCLGYVYERTQNLWVTILLHMTFNAANVILFVSQGNG